MDGAADAYLALSACHSSSRLVTSKTVRVFENCRNSVRAVHVLYAIGGFLKFHSYRSDKQWASTAASNNFN